MSELHVTFNHEVRPGKEAAIIGHIRSGTTKLTQESHKHIKKIRKYYWQYRKE
jgi:hypothetical protein